jgi:hypothetical protein
MDEHVWFSLMWMPIFDFSTTFEIETRCNKSYLQS